MEEKAEFYTAEEAAKVLRSHPYTVRRLCRETKVPAFKFGGQWRFNTVSQQLTYQYGLGYSKSSLSRMMSFAEKFPNKQIVATLLQQLGWSHFTILIAIKDKLKRDF